MEPWQLIVLGVMIALTPSLVVLAVLLVRETHEIQEEKRNGNAAVTHRVRSNLYLTMLIMAASLALVVFAFTGG